MSRRGDSSCAFRKCKNNSIRKKVSYFKFPTDPIMAKEWMKASSREDLMEHTVQQLSTYFKLCEEHFEVKYIKTNNIRKRLNKNAIPTIFEELSSVPVPELMPQVSNSATGTSSETCVDVSRGIALPSEESFRLQIAVSSVGTQTLSPLSCNTPSKEHLREGLKMFQRSNRNPVPQNIEQWGQEDFFRMCDEYLTKPLAGIIKSQAVLQDRCSRKKRYSREYNQFALTLHFLNPPAYSFLSSVFHLPSKRRLESVTANLFPANDLHNTSLFKTLETKVNCMSEPDKHCVLVIDKMPLKSHLFYSISRDEMIGLHRTGTKEALLAATAIIFIVKGIRSTWELPVAYFFVHSRPSTAELQSSVHNCICKLLQAGLYVNAIVTDVGTDFIHLATVLGVTSETQTFPINDRSVFYIFDACRLIVATRNNLFHHVFSDGERQSSWSFIEQFYRRDKQQLYRSAPKLTDAHIYPSFDKARVELATQVLSYSVASGMSAHARLGALPGAAYTVEIVGKFNQLFDILNSSSENNDCKFKNAFEGLDYQIQFLNEMVAFISDLRVRSRDGADLTSRSKFKTCWVVTIKSVLGLWRRLRAAGFESLRTRHFNRDCVESFFGSIRQQGGNHLNPTPIQFRNAFKKSFCEQYLHHPASMSCANDLDEVLTAINIADIVSTNVKELPGGSVPAVHLPDTDYRCLGFSERNAFSCICEYLLRKCLKIHRCDDCIQFSKACEELDISALLINFRSDDNSESICGGLRARNKQFIHYVYKLEQIFVSSFKDLAIEQGISRNYLQSMLRIPLDHPCAGFPRAYLIKLFIRLRIFYTLKCINAELKVDKSSCRKNGKIKVVSCTGLSR